MRGLVIGILMGMFAGGLLGLACGLSVQVSGIIEGVERWVPVLAGDEKDSTRTRESGEIAAGGEEPEPTPTRRGGRRPTPTPVPTENREGGEEEEGDVIPTPERRPRRPTPTPERDASSEEFRDSSSNPDGSPGDVPELPPADPEVLASGLRPGARDLLSAHEGVPHVRLAVMAEPDRRRLRGRMTVTFHNNQQVAVSHVCFRAFANAKVYGARTEVGGVRVNGQPAVPDWSGDRTAFTLTLPSPLRTRDSVEIEMIFTTTLPARPSGYGLMAAHPDGLMVAYFAHPELARMRDGRCDIVPVGKQGDIHQGDPAHYWWRIRHPAGMTAVAGGTPVRESEDLSEGVTPFARNVAIVVGRMDRVEAEHDGIRFFGYYRKASAADAEDAVEKAADSVRLFSGSFGEYPFSSLHIVEIPMQGGAAGMEGSRMIMVGEQIFTQDIPGMAGFGGGLTMDLLGFVVAHEAAHMWWYEQVGSDSVREPWLDEGLTNWSAYYWYENHHGKAAADEVMDLLILLPYRLVLADGDMPLNRPVDRYTGLQYAGVVYGKGAWMYEVLRKEMGEDLFFQFIRRYFERHRFDQATEKSWLETLSGVWGKDRAAAFHRKWVAGTSVTPADLPPGGPFAQMLEDPVMGGMVRALLESMMQMEGE